MKNHHSAIDPARPESRMRIWRFLRSANQGLSLEEIAWHCKLSRAETKSRLAEFKQEGFLRQIGDTYLPHWDGKLPWK